MYKLGESTWKIATTAVKLYMWKEKVTVGST